MEHATQIEFVRVVSRADTLADMNQKDTALVTEIRDLVETMYAGYLGGDRSAIDALLSPNLTMFDSASPELIDGMGELNQVRAARPSAESGQDRVQIETALTPDRFTARELGGVIIATWWLQIDAEDLQGRALSPEIVRNSAVLTRAESGKLAVQHIHEDVVQHFGVSA